ncbi:MULTISPECIES: OmpA family protein [unclassified Saccharothrix]|uniref:OmpA family protein n=1 Tax=unclassified Saccharothrix TaxID=2593673 RepID=UPI00307F50AE
MLRSPAWRAWLVSAVLVPALLAASGVFARARIAEREAAGRVAMVVRTDEVLLVGDVADESEHRVLLDAVRGGITSHRVTDLLAEHGNRSPLTSSTAAGVVAAAVAASAHDLTAVATAGTVTARATVPDERRAATLREALTGLGVQEPRVDVGAQVGGSLGGSDIDLAALQRSVTAMVEGNGGFRFAPSSTEWQGHGPVLVDRVGRLLLVAPKATITLNGHASTGHPDPHGLARQRAEAVRALFVAQGVRPERIRTAVVLDVAPENTDPAARQVDVLIS